MRWRLLIVGVVVLLGAAGLAGSGQRAAAATGSPLYAFNSGLVLNGTWGFLNMALGVTLASFAGYGAGAFSSPYFIRTFGLGLALVGVLFGIIGGVSSGSGTLVGGFVTDWLSKRSAAWYALIPGFGLAIAGRLSQGPKRIPYGGPPPAR